MKMKSLHLFTFCCLSAVCVEAGRTAVVEVSDHVGGEVSIHCTGNWTRGNSSEHYNLYFCKGVCSRGNILIQAMRKSTSVPRRGRYSMEVNRRDGDFSVTIRRLKKPDAGRYRCGVGETLNVLYQDVNLIVLNASTVPPGSPPSTTTLQTEEGTVPQGNLTSSAPPSLETQPTAEDKTIPQSRTKFTDTTLVIIISVSLALLVCAIIPLIFYGHCRTNAEGQNKPEASKGEADRYENNAEVSSTHAAVRMQSLEPDSDAESSVQDASQYAAVYQALDPQSLD